MAEPTPAPALSRDAVERVYRLTPLQAGMLFHELQTPGASPYHRQVRFELAGEVDAAACEAAWNGLLARHALLRSVFDWERTAQPLQIVLKQQRVAFEAHDADAGAVAAWCAADVARGFDLRREPLLRVALFRLAPARYELVWSHPHILLDGWSGAVLMEEFAALYAAARNGSPAALPPPTDPDGYMAEAALRDVATALPHWRELLAGYDTLATLPRLPRLPRSDAPARMEERCVQFDAPDAHALRALAQRHGATLGVLLQALWGLILARWTGRDDVVFGSVTSGRSLATPGIERLVGMFVNTLPVRVQLSDDDTLATLLARLQQQADASSAHDHVGLATLQNLSALPGGLLDHLLVLENFPSAETSVDTGFRVVATHAAESANYDFGLIVHSDDAGLRITLQHDASRIDGALVARVAQHWRTLAAALLAAPAARLVDLDVLPADERARLAAVARGPRVERDAQATLASLWQAQVERTPDAPALTDAHVTLGYSELDRAAAGVAARLRAGGVGRDDVVGALCGRGAARIVALLGVLKAGATWLPLSPALPDARIALMLADSGCRRVLTDAAGAARLDALAPDLRVMIDGPAAGAELPSPATPDTPAYLIYTSGSTGQPKGVAVSHAGFVNMILAQIAGFGVRADDAVVQFASCSFDASLSEIFMALLAGARLVVASEAAIRDGAALLALLDAEQITVATLPPSYLRALDGAALGRVRVLITAGEPPDSADMRRLARTLDAFNAYGPTEASVCASWHRIDADADYAHGIPIGRAIANTAMSIRDRRGRLMPLGAPGEIWLAGRGLAQGYVGQAALTAERFPTVDGERYYRTGDLGVLRDDGDVLYAGRIDAQVKLNGRRIELGEVEAALRTLPQVAQAAATTVDGRLVGFVVAAADDDDGDVLRQRLAHTLPAWMVPAAIVAVHALPTTLAGKVDRRALAALVTRAAAAPRALTPAEAHIAQAFAAILGGGPYAPDSSFAGSGGDSLRAIRLLTRLRREGLGVSLPALLAADTVAAIARLESDAPAAAPAASAGPVPLTPIQRRHFRGDPDGRARLTHQVLLRLRSAERLHDAVASLWRRHDALRLRFARNGAEWTARCLPADAPLAWRSVDLRGADAAALVADAQAHAPGGAGEPGPLFVATHYRLDDGEHVLLAAHHLLVDALSWRILLEDLADALAGAAAPTGASWRDWATALAAVDVERERAYWTSLANLPTRVTPEHGYDETEIVTRDLGPVASGMSERSVLAALLARLGAALAQRDHGAAIGVTLSSHGRHLPDGALDLGRSVGWFTAEYPFRLACGATPEAIETALRTVPSQGVGYGVLRWLAADPIAGAEPAIAVNYLGDVDPATAAPFALDDRLPGVVVAGLRRTRALEIEAWRSGGRLLAAIRYAPRCDAPAAIRQLADVMSRVPAAAAPRERVASLQEGSPA